MQPRGEGAIVNISSMGGRRARRGKGIFRLQGGRDRLTKALAKEAPPEYG